MDAEIVTSENLPTGVVEGPPQTSKNSKVDETDPGDPITTSEAEQEEMDNQTTDGSSGVNQNEYVRQFLQSSVYQENDIEVSPEVIEQLTQGIVGHFLPSLKQTQAKIAQIKDSQQVLIDTVEQENNKFFDCHAITRLESTMNKAKAYHTKLVKLRKEMTALHEKSAKLKRRAVKLQQQKQKEEMTKAHMMEKEYEREKMLTARVASEPKGS